MLRFAILISRHFCASALASNIEMCVLLQVKERQREEHELAQSLAEEEDDDDY